MDAGWMHADRLSVRQRRAGRDGGRLGLLGGGRGLGVGRGVRGAGGVRRQAVGRCRRPWERLRHGHAGAQLRKAEGDVGERGVGRLTDLALPMRRGVQCVEGGAVRCGEAVQQVVLRIDAGGGMGHDGVPRAVLPAHGRLRHAGFGGTGGGWRCCVWVRRQALLLVGRGVGAGTGARRAPKARDGAVVCCCELAGAEGRVRACVCVHEL